MKHWMKIIENFEEIRYEFSYGKETLLIIQDQIQKGNNPFNDIKFLESSEIKREDHFVAWLGDTIVGMAGIEKNPYNNNEMWGKFVSVQPSYQGKGIGGNLMRLVLKYCKDNGFTFSPSSYTDDGEQKLKPIVDKNY